MTEHPLLLNDAMVRARRAGRTTQTRRPMKPQPFFTEGGLNFGSKMFLRDRGGFRYSDAKLLTALAEIGPFGKPGDKLWIRETWRLQRSLDDVAPNDVWCGEQIQYKEETDHFADAAVRSASFCPGHWRPSIHMPRWASRDSVLVKRVWCERLQDISEADAIAEGIKAYAEGGYKIYSQTTLFGTSDPIASFASLWDSIYSFPKRVPAKGPVSHYVSHPWEDVQETRDHKGKPWIVNGNPWNWACEFEEAIT